MKVLVTGASGLVGSHLISMLKLQGHEVSALVRSPHKINLPAKNVFKWTDNMVAPMEAFRGVDAVVHLAAEGIADRRWNKQRKRRLIESRSLGTKNLLEGLALLPVHQRPQTFIAASAIGYYGDTEDAAVDEDSPSGQGFLSEICQVWEQSSLGAQMLGLRTVILRIGLVLAQNGGVLAKMGPVVLGSGRQWMSWIHIEDLQKFILSALSDTGLKGVYNLTSPQPMRASEFIKVLAQVKGYPLVFRAPEWALRLGLGEMAQLLLMSQKVIPTRLMQLPFEFEHPDLLSALKQATATRP